MGTSPSAPKVGKRIPPMGGEGDNGGDGGGGGGEEYGGSRSPLGPSESAAPWLEA